MTAIVAYAHGSRVYMGADSRVSDGDQHWSIGRSKIVSCSKALVGFCGDLACLNAAWYHLRVRAPKARQTADEWTARELVPAMRMAIAAQLGCSPAELPADRPRYSAVVAVRGTMAMLDGTEVVLPAGDCYACVGSGAPYASAVLASLDRPKPAAAILAALDAASRHDLGCAPPYTYATT
jgi:ATP-dependent protease HslVU (ClpYQ) peptidase subunit